MTVSYRLSQVTLSYSPLVMALPRLDRGIRPGHLGEVTRYDGIKNTVMPDLIRHPLKRASARAPIIDQWTPHQVRGDDVVVLNERATLEKDGPVKPGHDDFR